MSKWLSLCLALICAMPLMAADQGFTPEQFVAQLANMSVGNAQPGNEQDVSIITWGGESALFEANGRALKTQPNSKFAQLGIQVSLIKTDDPVEQVRKYMSGERPVLRMTKRMLGMVSETIGADERTKPVVILKISYSGGDHIVGVGMKTLNDLKGKVIACQQGGPHVGLLYDALETAGLTKDDVTIFWVKDLTGPNGAAEALRGGKAQAACVITPDMLGLTGGVDAVGSGAEGTVQGGRVVCSTQQMSRSVVDVVAVRSDFFKANISWINSFVGGYLWGVDQVVPMRQGFETSQQMSPEYEAVLNLCQTTFGEEVIPTIEVDGHGLLLDCYFSGLATQIAYFYDRGNAAGFAAKMKAAQDLATRWGYASSRVAFGSPKLDYKAIASAAGITYREPKLVQRIDAEAVDVFPDSALDDRTIVEFTIHFKPNQVDFSFDQYGADFDRAIKAASTFGNAVIAVRGHSDPTKTLVDLVQGGMSMGLIERSGSRGSYRYAINGVALDLSQTTQVVKLIDSGVFDKASPNPRERMQAALNLSLARANAIREAIGKRAQQTGVNLDLSQVKPVGAGIFAPFIAKPTSLAEAKQNMRVEFKIIKVPAEAIRDEDFSSI